MAGKIEVVTGPMKCGKSEEILRRIKRFKIAGLNVLLVKPSIDKRFSEGKIVSRDDRKADCTVIPANNPEYIFSLVDKSINVVVIDEAQFFKSGPFKPCNADFICNDRLTPMCSKECTWYVGEKPVTIVDVVQKLCDDGHYVIVAGLDMTSERKPFGEMPKLLAVAHDVTKLKSVCEDCKSENGIYSFANFNKTEDVVVGDTEYTTLCHACYMKRLNKRG